MTTRLKDDLFIAQALRALGYAPYGGADIGECIVTTERITSVDLDLWFEEWMSTATRLRAVADASVASGDCVGARSAYLRASNYFRTAGLFALQRSTLDRARATHLAERESFRRGVALLDLPPVEVEIPYEGSTLPGYFFRASADDVQRRTLIITNGYDGSAEELYFSNAVAALERGYNVLLFDGPGQGSMIIERGIPFRPDWENVITPVVDFALTLPTVDPEALVLLGLSFGGYLAPRAATSEHRLAACISDCGPYDLFDASVSRLPGFLAKALGSESGPRLALLKQVLRVVLGKPTLGWALRRNLLVHDVATAVDFFRLAPDYSLKGIEHLIECPTLVCSAEGDDLSERAPALFDALTCEKAYVQFSAADGAGSHCEGSARTLFHARAFGWLEAVLGGEVARERRAGLLEPAHCI
jgi:pimeloyl-ACP methyl ester carboxylesterase